MKQLTPDDFKFVLKQADISSRLRRKVKFPLVTARMTPELWENTELLAIPDKSGNEGVLVVEVQGTLYAKPYELSRGITDRTGRSKPVICDFCYTWQAGANVARVTFEKNTGGAYHTVTFLCCADLACSRHVRGNTAAARSSRAQLREDIAPQQRIERLKTHLAQIMDDIGVLELKI